MILLLAGRGVGAASSSGKVIGESEQGPHAAGPSLLLLSKGERSHGFGPRSLRASMGAAVVAFAVIQLAPVGVGLMIQLPFGTYAALFGCALPTFLVAFLASAWLIRVLAAALGGSSGGGGHRVPAHARFS
jgi:hypothetical protein